MLNQIENNTYSFSVSSRESFLYKLDFENQQVIFVYTCKTDNYTYTEKHDFLDYGFLEENGYCRLDPGDYEPLVTVINESILNYLSTNIISGSVRRAWIKFKDELLSIYNSLIMSQTYKIL